LSAPRDAQPVAGSDPNSSRPQWRPLSSALADVATIYGRHAALTTHCFSGTGQNSWWSAKRIFIAQTSSFRMRTVCHEYPTENCFRLRGCRFHRKDPFRSDPRFPRLGRDRRAQCIHPTSYSLTYFLPVQYTVDNTSRRSSHELAMRIEIIQHGQHSPASSRPVRFGRWRNQAVAEGNHMALNRRRGIALRLRAKRRHASTRGPAVVNLPASCRKLGQWGGTTFTNEGLGRIGVGPITSAGTSA